MSALPSKFEPPPPPISVVGPPPDFYEVENGSSSDGGRGRRETEVDDAEENPKGGIGWFVAALFVVGDMAGGGLVALPTAMIQSGFWIGLLFSVVMTLMFMYTSCLLGRNWVILRRRWPVYRKHCRQPYPEMGRRAFGGWMRNVVSTFVDMNQFGTTVVYLLLSAKNIHDSLKAFFNTNISFCLLLVVLALLLLPITFLNSPQDFWLAAVIAVCTTSTAVVLICIGSLLDYGDCGPHHAMPEFHPANYFLALGTLLFAYGGHPAFPTVQHDMRRPSDFNKSSFAAFTILFSMYTPVCILGYMTYGNSLRESVINSLQHVWIQQIVNVMITLHLIFTILIVNNPLNQKMEEVFRVPHKFGLKRVVVRTTMMGLVLFVAETVPTFGPLLDLIGGSCLMLTSLVFPCLFYLFLNAAEIKANQQHPLSFDQLQQKDKNNGGAINKWAVEDQQKDEEGERASWADVVQRTDRFTLYSCLFIIVFGLLGGAAATFSAIRELGYAHFVPPCYFSYLIGDSEPNAGGHVNCCGPFQNISIFHQPDSCSPQIGRAHV